MVCLAHKIPDRAANFGATPGANTVRFNGTVATVSSASSIQLVATVPAGATTGAISVQTTAGTGTSAQSFAVTGSATELPPPTVSGISPASGIVGASITISGTNFNTTPGMTKVYLNQTLAVIQSISATSITITVPKQTGSGRIRVVTLSGEASSASDLVVIPQNGHWQQADFSGTTLRVALGGSVSGNLAASTTQTRWLVILFGGGSDVPMTIDFPAFTGVWEFLGRNQSGAIRDHASAASLFAGLPGHLPLHALAPRPCSVPCWRRLSRRRNRGCV